MSNVFLDRTRPTLLALSAKIAVDEHLASARRASIRSAINTLCRVMGLPPAAVPADLDFVRRKLEQVGPAAIGVKDKRFATVKSEVAFALRHLGLVGKGTYLTPMVGDWLVLWEHLPDKYARTNFSRFFRYCSALGIDPSDVTDSIAGQFRQALVDKSFVKDPRVNHQNLCRLWNRMIGVVPNWPERRLAVPCYTNHYIFPPEAFPPALWADVDAWLRRQAHDDILALDASPEPLAPRTIKQYRYSVRAFASMLVRRGHNPKAITSLAYLVRPKNVQDGLRFLLDRHGSNKRLRSAADHAILLRKIAKYWVKAPKNAEIIAQFARNLMPRGDGVGKKNRQRLVPLRDERNLVRLFLLPGKIRKNVERGPNVTRRQALQMQFAVALIILTYAPLRIGNLAGLHIERHLRWSGAGMTGTLVFDIEGGEVKNGQTLSFPLPADAADLIRLYLREYQPRLTGDPSPFLFPSNLPGRPKRSDTLGKQLNSTDTKISWPYGKPAPLSTYRPHHCAQPIPRGVCHDLTHPRP